ncbi:MAG: hypothetical protein MI974_28055 [Chitinophagales bacterium]|nr:hypothetical protein [Chitinophagales bacterium]
MKRLSKMFHRLLIMTALCIGWTLSSNAQTTTQYGQSEKLNLSKKERQKLSSKYIGVHVGINSLKFRDFATSPLFYKGLTTHVGLSRLKVGQRKEAELALNYSFGNPMTDFNENVTVSQFKRVEIYYSQLYKLGGWSNDKYNTKLGWMLNATGNLRTNAALQNNAFGLEFFPTLFLSFKLNKDISRTEEKNKRFLFFKYKLKEKQRDLSLRLNVGLLNSSYRNGYVYSGQSAILNEPSIIDGYQFNAFSGFRASTGLDYTLYLNNKNAVQISYIWDAYHTGGDLDKFEMANHIIKFSLLFNSNNQ